MLSATINIFYQADMSEGLIEIVKVLRVWRKVFVNESRDEYPVLAEYKVGK